MSLNGKKEKDINYLYKNNDFATKSQVPKNDPIKMSPYLEIDASSDADSFEIVQMRLSAFHNSIFC